MERIYIGGLNPPKLTAKEVAARLDTIPDIEIHSTDLVGEEKSFFYVNATSTDVHSSALDKIAKLYNNVTWKQCKLVVEAARPHFLQRLEQERAERQRAAAIKNENEQDQQRQQKIPRHLRIRQKYGQEAHKVDTKPCQTQEWKEFCRVVSKLRTRRQEYNSTKTKLNKREAKDKVQLANQRALRNRAVHLRWTDSEPSLVERVSGGEESSSGDNLEVSKSSQESVSDDSSEVSTTDNAPVMNGTHSTYVWSDDESDSGESSEDDEQEVIAVVDKPDPRVEDGVQGPGESSYDDESITCKSDTEKEKEHVVSRHMQQEEKYEWSSDESIDEGDDEAQPRQTALPLQPPSTKDTTEFSAAIDFDDDNDDSDDSDDASFDSNEQANGSADESQNLDGDVKANLSVLSSLFPDMAETKPVQIFTDEREKGRSESMGSGWEEAPSSFGSHSMSAGLGLMRRFDPTKESAKKYIIEPSKTEVEEKGEEAEPEGPEEHESQSESSNDDQSVSDDSSSVESEPTAAPTQLEEGDSKKTVYEQGKLEDIFRQARSSGGTEAFKLSSMFESKIKQQDAGKDKPFSFGFDLGGESTSTKQSEPQSGGFTFGFDVGSKQPQGSERENEGEPTAAVQPEQNSGHATSEQEAEQVPTGIRRRGLYFPEDVLDEYVKEFLNMNEGSRIREDPQGFLHDESVKQQWKKERHALTLDWKRKRKYAQSRMQKKMKFR